MRVGVIRGGLACLLTIALFYLAPFGCGGGGGDDDDDDADNEDATVVQEDEGLTCGGETSASLASGTITIDIPNGQIDSCANAQPSLSLTIASSGTLQDNEVNISANGQSVKLDLQGDFGATTTPGDDSGTDNDVTITLPYDETNIGAGDEDSLHVYVVAEDPTNDVVVPLVGDLDTVNNTITVNAKGLPEETLFTVVYNADAAAIASDDASISEFVLADPLTLTLADWPTNVWCVVWDPTNNTLRTVVAGIVGVAADALTNDQIRTVLAERVARNARVSGNEYQALEFRAPHLYVQSPTAATRACSGTDQPVYFVHMVYGEGSFFRPNDPAENADVDTLAGFGNKFGRLYVDSNRLDDAENTGLGTVEASIAHEMFHGIQAGYEIGAPPRLKGLREGTAATVGKTLDGDGTRTSEPEVRNFADEIYDLSVYLLIDGANYRYRNQDFFAYLARRYNGNSFDYLPTLFAAFRNRIAALATAAERRQPPWATMYTALNDGVTNGISSSLDLPRAYFTFAIDRLVEHSASSRFGRTNEVVDPGTLAEGLLTVNAGLLAPLSGNPDTLDETKTSNRMGSYSTRVFKVTPTRASSEENGRKLTVTVTPSAGTFGTDFRVKYYRGGSASGTTAASNSFEIRNWAQETDDEIIVVVVNSQATLDVTFTYRAVTEEETSSTDNTIDWSRYAQEATQCVSDTIAICPGGEGGGTNETNCAVEGTRRCSYFPEIETVQISFRDCKYNPDSPLDFCHTGHFEDDGGDPMATNDATETTIPFVNQDLLRANFACNFTFNASFDFSGNPLGGTVQVNCGASGVQTCSVIDFSCSE